MPDMVATYASTDLQLKFMIQAQWDCTSLFSEGEAVAADPPDPQGGAPCTMV